MFYFYAKYGKIARNHNSKVFAQLSFDRKRMGKVSDLPQVQSRMV